MAHSRNEITPQLRTIWQNNFNDERDNIFAPFQNTPIVLTRQMYEDLCLRFNSNIRIYFGKDNAGSPKLIAVAALRINELDSENLELAWDDVAGPDSLFELYSGNSITISNANSWISNWTNDHANDELFVKSFLLPRTNFINIFETRRASYALIDFGLKKEITVMTQVCDVNGLPDSNPIVNNRSFPCPPFCNKFSPIG